MLIPTLIKDLSLGEKLTGLHALVLDAKESLTKNGKSYLDITIGDTSGSLRCKVWNWESFLPVHHLAKTGNVLKFDIEVGSYQGALQGVITKIEPSDKPSIDFAKGTRFSVEMMTKDLYRLMVSMEKPLARFLTFQALNDPNYSKAPAAKAMHNGWIGGLIEHAWSMAKIAVPLIEHYQESYKIPVVRDYVLFGVICHDYGKITEYEYSTGACAYSPTGILTPHIVSGIGWIYQKCEELRQILKEEEKEGSPKIAIKDSELFAERDQLVHILASHHGKLEFGSPVVPATLEAILVHTLDMIDSRFMHALELVEGKEGEVKGFSVKSFTEKVSFMQYK